MRSLSSLNGKLRLFDCVIYKDRIEAGAAYIGGVLPDTMEILSELGRSATVKLPVAFCSVQTTAFEVNVTLIRCH